MTNFDRWRGCLTPAEIADLFSNCDSDACAHCPAAGCCDLDSADEWKPDPTLGDACRQTFLHWAQEKLDGAK